MDFKDTARISIRRGVKSLLSAGFCASIAAFLIGVFAGRDLNCGFLIGGLCLCASFASMLPFRSVSGAGIVAAALISMAVRIALAAIGAGLICAVSDYSSVTIGFWMVYWYSLFLAIEIAWLRRCLASHELPEVIGRRAAC